MILSHIFLAGHRGREMALKALLKNRVGVLRPSLGVTRAKGPAHTSLGQHPRSRAPTNNPKRQRRGPNSEIVEPRMCVPDRAGKPFKGVSKKQTACYRQGMGLNSTSVMPGIQMKRAFSALASPVRLPSPLGWAGIMGAFGAPRFAGAVAMPQDAKPEKSHSFVAGRGSRASRPRPNGDTLCPGTGQPQGANPWIHGGKSGRHGGCLSNSRMTSNGSRSRMTADSRSIALEHPLAGYRRAFLILAGLFAAYLVTRFFVNLRG